MPAAEYDFDIEQGAEFDRTITWRNSDDTLKDLTGYTAKLQGRFKKSSTSVLFELNTSDSTIVLGGALGTIQLKQTLAQTRLFTFAVAVYDLELTPSGGNTRRLLEGRFLNSLEVTR